MGINQLWIVVAALVVLVLVTRARARRKMSRLPKRPPAGPRIQGYQVAAFLHPRMSAACVYDNGVQFGRGFRRKEGPQLPHDAACKCEVVTFSFTSSEVFNGALRELGAIKSTVEGLAPADALELLERLKTVDAAPPTDAAAYGEALQPGTLPPAVQDRVRAFAAERHAFLMQSARDGAAPSAALPTDSMRTSEQT